MPFENYEIIADHDNIGSLVNIETIKPTSDTRYFCPPQGYALYDPGLLRELLYEALLYEAGYATTTWLFSVLTRLQYEYLRDTYAAGGYRGLVTIRTRTDRVAYDYFNATIDIPKLTTVQKQDKVFFDFPIRFLRMVGI
jgi:hypothetical protein